MRSFGEQLTQVCLCFFGDGAANSGPFIDSFEPGSRGAATVIFLCENETLQRYIPGRASDSGLNTSPTAALLASVHCGRAIREVGHRHLRLPQ